LPAVPAGPSAALQEIRYISMGALRFGRDRVPARDGPERAIELLEERGYTACEIDFEGKFWVDYPWAERFGELAREAGIVLSVHAPIAGFMGHAERGRSEEHTSELQSR